MPVGKYSHLVSVVPAGLLFLAGRIAVDTDGNTVGEGDIAAQTRKTDRNIGYVLGSMDASFSDVVQFTTYVVGQELVRPYLAAKASVFEELYPDGIYPPNTLLVVSGLVREEYLLEVTTVAANTDHRRSEYANRITCARVARKLAYHRGATKGA